MRLVSAGLTRAASGLAQLHQDTTWGLNACPRLQNEIAEKQARQNDYKRQLTDISRTLTMLGVEHQLQVSTGQCDTLPALKGKSGYCSCCVGNLCSI